MGVDSVQVIRDNVIVLFFLRGEMMLVEHPKLAARCVPVTLPVGMYQLEGFYCCLSSDTLYDEYPTFGDGFRNCYGVCDNPEQVLEAFPELQSSNRQFTVIVTEIDKADQTEDGGWRWHKWGPYIGKQTPTCEYLYDEPLIDRVYVYHIYERLV